MPERETIAVGIPDQRGVVSFEIASALLQGFGTLNEVIWNKGCAYVGRARNAIVARLLEKPNVHRLLFIDTDINPTIEQINRITSHDVDIAAGLYPGKSSESHAFLWPQQNGLTGLQPVQRIATGFMCIRRGVFDRIMATHGHRYYYDFTMHQLVYDFFPAGLEFGGLDDQGNRVWMTEDYSFCEMARAAGIAVHADYDVRVGHLGSCEYKVAPNKPAKPPAI